MSVTTLQAKPEARASGIPDSDERGGPPQSHESRPSLTGRLETFKAYRDVSGE